MGYKRIRVLLLHSKHKLAGKYFLGRLLSPISPTAWDMLG